MAELMLSCATRYFLVWHSSLKDTYFRGFKTKDYEGVSRSFSNSLCSQEWPWTSDISSPPLKSLDRSTAPGLSNAGDQGLKHRRQAPYWDRCLTLPWASLMETSPCIGKAGALPRAGWEKLNCLLLQKLKKGRPGIWANNPSSSFCFIFLGTSRGWQGPSHDSFADETSSHLKGFTKSLAWCGRYLESEH